MIIGIHLLLVLIGAFAGRVLANVTTLWVRRLAGWLVVVAVVTGSHVVLADAGSVVRMVGICCVLLSGMKGLVYAEWAGGARLTLPRYCVFCFLWFGMDPGSFRSRRLGLSWKPDVQLGLLLMLLGALLGWLVWRIECHQLLLVFLPMSLGFHFGALRVLKGCLRAVGFPVRTLFPNVLNTQSLGDFWSRRWNVGYSQMMQRVVGRPVARLAGESTGVFAVFVVSGVLHDLAITLPVQSEFGLPTLYFTLHGVLVVIERRRGRPFGRLLALLAVILPLGLLFPPAFLSEVLLKCLSIFSLVG